MPWTINYNQSTLKKVKRFDPQTRRRIKTFLTDRLANHANPRTLGTQLVGRSDIWRYRVGNYRILCEIQDQQITILVIDIDYRSRIYRESK